MQKVAQVAWLLLLVAALPTCRPVVRARPTRTMLPSMPASTVSPTSIPTDTAAATTTLAPSASPTTEPSPTATRPPTPVAAAPTRTPPPDPEDLGFHPVDFGGFPVQALWVAPDGHLWADSDAGLWEYTDELIFRVRTRTLDVQIVGADDYGRIWALFDGGNTIAYHISGADWVRFGSEEGWEMAVDVEIGGSFATDHQTSVWLALGRAGLRRFNPNTNRWQTLRAADIGFEPPSGDDVTYDDRLAFTDVVTDSFGNVWVSACAVLEDGPFPLLLGRGQGVRWFDGNVWAGAEQTTDRCVMDMQVDGDGRIWLAGPQNDLGAGENNFVRYDPNLDLWEFVPVPETSDQFSDRPRFVRAVSLDEAGRIWLFVARRGGASLPPDAVYYQASGEWVPFLEQLPGFMTFAPDNTVWAWIKPGYLAQPVLAGLSRYRDGAWLSLDYPWSSPLQEMAVDGNIRLWFYLADDPWILWYYDLP